MSDEIGEIQRTSLSDAARSDDIFEILGDGSQELSGTVFLRELESDRQDCNSTRAIYKEAILESI